MMTANQGRTMIYGRLCQRQCLAEGPSSNELETGLISLLTIMTASILQTKINWAFQ